MAITEQSATPVTDAIQITEYELTKRPRRGEAIIQTILFICGALSILTTVGIVYILGSESLKFFTSEAIQETNKELAISISPEHNTFDLSAGGSAISAGDTLLIGDEKMKALVVEGNTVVVERGYDGAAILTHPEGEAVEVVHNVSPLHLFSGTEWNPQIGKFGILPLINATVMTSLIAMLVALPLGLGSAIYMSEYASDRARNILKPILETLAGIPTVVYGYFALTFMTPLLRSIFGNDLVKIFNVASAGIVVGILIIPLVASMSEDALHAVPDSLRQAAFGLGATKLETSLQVVLPAALSGISAAFVVAISRAIGETMIVAIAAGAGPNFTFNPFNSAETMTGHIVRISGGDLSYQSIDYNSLFAIGLMLFLMTLALNLFSQRIVTRFREVYE